MKHNIKILLNGNKYDGYEYFEVDDNAVKAVRHLMEDAGYLPMESKSWDVRCLPLPSCDNWQIPSCDNWQSNAKPARKWMTAEEGLKKFMICESVWALRDGNVEEWLASVNHDCYFSWNPDHASEWAKAHQPSHVMEWREGEEAPKPPVIETPVKFPLAKDGLITWGNHVLGFNENGHVEHWLADELSSPPVIEKTLYEKVKVICESNKQWTLKQNEIIYESPGLWDRATDRKNLITNEISTGYASHLICDFALQIAKEDEEKEKELTESYTKIMECITDFTGVNFKH